MSQAPIEGALDISLKLAGNRIAEVAIGSSRTVRAGAMLEGRPIAEALRLLPKLFSLCGSAQFLAAQAAVEGALGFAPDPGARQIRAALLAAETAQEHGTRILIDWPKLAGLDPDLAAARDLRRALALLRQRLHALADWTETAPPQCDPAEIETAASAAQAAAGRAIFGADPGDWLALAEAEQLHRWLALGPTAAARVLRAVVSEKLADFGASGIGLMGDFDPEILDRRMASDLEGAYLARPDWQNAVLETGPLARFSDHPLIASLRAAHGNGLLTRLAARLLECAQTLVSLRGRSFARADFSKPGDLSRAGSGLGQVEAARGRLAHRAEIGGGTIRRYQILAPTEWNFHPRGPLAEGLRGAEAPSPREAEHRAQLLVAALDPCVAFKIRVA